MSNNNGYLDMELLRFTTAGSVDDGKSTLIGRLLNDSKSIFEDQLEAIKSASIKRGNEFVNLALLTDGLKAEREQGITIDVAYRYFATPKRKFIIADTPGHIQYTRNMVTGASTADAALILVDSRNGVLEQTHRHTIIASLLGIPHIVVCVNKMDMVGYSQEVFGKICGDFDKMKEFLKLKDVHYIPISALKGDNVVNPSENMPWYQGPTLMNLLETLPVSHQQADCAARFPVQYVIRPISSQFPDYRGFAGRIASGSFHVGQEIMVQPSGLCSRIKHLHFAKKDMEQARSPLSISMELEDEIDISRGDMIVPKDQPAMTGNEVDMMMCWMNQKPLQIGGKYCLIHPHIETRCIVKEVNYLLDVNTFEKKSSAEVGLNSIASVHIKTMQPIVYDRYVENRITGSLILIDESTNETVAAGMIL